GEAVTARMIDYQQRTQHVAGAHGALARVDDLRDGVALEGGVHQHRLLAALCEDARDLRAYQACSNHQCGHLILPVLGVSSAATRPEEKPDGHERRQARPLQRIDPETEKDRAVFSYRAWVP